MTHEAYLTRITALGYNRSSWARHCDVTRKTVERQCMGKIPIRRTFWLALDREDGLGWPD